MTVHDQSKKLINGRVIGLTNLKESPQKSKFRQQLSGSSYKLLQTRNDELREKLEHSAKQADNENTLMEIAMSVMNSNASASGNRKVEKPKDPQRAASPAALVIADNT